MSRNRIAAKSIKLHKYRAKCVHYFPDRVRADRERDRKDMVLETVASQAKQGTSIYSHEQRTPGQEIVYWDQRRYTPRGSAGNVSLRGRSHFT